MSTKASVPWNVDESVALYLMFNDSKLLADIVYNMYVLYTLHSACLDNLIEQVTYVKKDIPSNQNCVARRIVFTEILSPSIMTAATILLSNINVVVHILLLLADIQTVKNLSVHTYLYKPIFKHSNKKEL